MDKKSKILAFSGASLAVAAAVVATLIPLCRGCNDIKKETVKTLTEAQIKGENIVGIKWDELIEGDEYIILKKNGEPFMKLNAVLPGTFTLGIAYDPNIKRPELKHRFAPPFDYVPPTRTDIKLPEPEPFPTVTLTRPYYIGQTEVTIDQYRYVMETWNRNHPKLAVELSPGSADLEKRFDKSAKNKFTGDCPVDRVSWYEAMFFCQALEESGMLPKGTKCMLPTEIQWEFAARGGNKEWKKYYHYSGTNDKQAAKSQSKGYPKAGNTIPNGLNIRGMSDEIEEWCLDDFENKLSKLKPEFTRSHFDTSRTRRSVRGPGEVYTRSPSRMNNIAIAELSNFNCGWPKIGFRIVLIPAEPIKEKEITIYTPDQVKKIKVEKKDKVAPKIQFLFTTIFAGSTVEMKVSDDNSGVDPDTISVQTDGQKAPHKHNNGTVSVSTGHLKTGKHTVRITLKDKAGNQGSGSAEIQVDRDPPVFSGFQPENGKKTALQIRSVSVRIRDILSGVDPGSIRLTVDGKAVRHRFDAATGRISFHNKFTNGTHSFTAGAKDKAGNYGSCSWQIHVDSGYGVKKADYYELVVGSEKLKMPLLKPRTFMIGREIDSNGKICDDPATAHERIIKTGFYMGETEISQAMYNEVITRWNTANPRRKLDPLPAKEASARKAVTRVNWHEAMIFCEFLNKNGFAPQGAYFTLPTEVLWEFAARSCGTDKYTLFSGSNTPDNVANHSGNCRAQPVMAQKAPNAMNLYDMSGGVMEWTLDDRQENSKRLKTIYRRTPYSGKRRPSQTRGGSWLTAPDRCHVISRTPEMAFDKETRREDLGFRIVLITK